jgi:3-deoxy-D-manno-octulosonic-acid transferase
LINTDYTLYFWANSTRLSLFLYTIFLHAYTASIRLAALWNPKARLWVRGRKAKQWSIESTKGAKGKTIWMHCASLGEFEQGRPLLEALKAAYPAHRIVLSFFSPSGYEVKKEYEGADAVYYLPMDGKNNAAQFIDAVNPSLVLWVKYEYWYYYLTGLQKRGIPVLLISGIFRPGQAYFKWYGGVWQQMLHCFTLLFVQNETSKSLLGNIGVSDKVMITGDTRFDRVLQLAAQAEEIPAIAAFCNASRVFVAGSTWEEDEAELIHYVRAHPEVKFIIAPHEIHASNLQDVKKEFKGGLFYSEWSTSELPPDTHILIIDNVGMLSRLYRYADIAYIGGGFGSDGVHNVLEAAVYGKPVIFGPEYEKYIEAVGLVDCGGAFSIDNALELEKLVNRLLTDDVSLAAAGNSAGEFVRQHAGAAEKIVRCIQEKRLLTS